MADGLFFASWALWEQMTFVLAVAIVLVFFAGLTKLWVTNRIMRKQEILDEEKRARLAETRKAGLTVKQQRGHEIPFGVRAIQSGVQVEGIWISRPPSPNADDTTKLASSASLVTLDSDSTKKGKQVADDSMSPSTSTFVHERTAGSEPSTTIPKGYAENNNSFDNITLSASPVTRPSTHPKKQRRQGISGDQDNSMGSRNGHHQGRPLYETYVPTSTSRGPRLSSRQSSASSSASSQSRAGGSGGSDSRTSSRSSRLYMARAYEDRAVYSAILQSSSPEKEPHDPFETPMRTPSSFTVLSPGDPSTPLMQSQDPAVPEPTFGPGDLHVNRSSRRVNQGFEVLPAGTFGTLQELRSDTGLVDQEHPDVSRSSKSFHRLKKQPPGQNP
ncbi:hypothetical protein P8C59_007837 [Phyllachora maydis]|uniref:Uncharacterized protein n=1 Tax=Phyllachora maydis TaxID=1825666 RepID=A0AAD9MDY3_9PEZI|nr:hypothetical protein P8C59_007837 [Phyllachora maydis]